MPEISPISGGMVLSGYKRACDLMMVCTEGFLCNHSEVRERGRGSFEQDHKRKNFLSLGTRIFHQMKLEFERMISHTYKSGVYFSR